MATRREFIGRAGTVAGAAAFGLAGYPGGAVALPGIDPEPAGRSRRTNQPGLGILILGGTGFIGPHVVRHALARGHEITLFNRGRTNTHLFPEVEKLVGDRNDDVSALEGRRWDAVIDNSGYTPDQVRLTVDALKDATAQYLFTSTRAVYTDYTAPVMNEDAPVGPMDLPESEWRGYGPNKVLAERVVEGGFGTRTLIVRPPVIVGPGDRSDRFTYWPDRIDAGGEVLVQGDPTDPVQFIDVRGPGGVLRAPARAADRGRLQQRGTGRAAVVGRTGLRDSRHHRHAGVVHLGGLGLSGGAGADAAAAACVLAAAARAVPQLWADGQQPWDRGGAAVSAAGRDREGHAGLASQP